MYIVSQDGDTGKVTVRKKVTEDDQKIIKTVVSAPLEYLLNKVFKKK